eukprot:scaffold49646_cov37-Prasinocladus_malaysianus.AAC.1
MLQQPHNRAKDVAAESERLESGRGASAATGERPVEHRNLSETGRVVLKDIQQVDIVVAKWAKAIPRLRRLELPENIHQ